MYGEASPELEHVSAEEAIALAAGESVLVDVRESWEFEAGHAPSALHMPMSELEARFEELPEDVTLLVICHVGQRSLMVTEALVRAGYPAVTVDGGMLAWRAAGGALVADGPNPPRV